MDFRDKIVVITGASSGIGFTTARAFADRGATVVAVARREERLRGLVGACRPSSPRTTYLCGDLAGQDFAESVIDETVRRFGRIDVLVNNAAVSKHKQIYHVDADEAQWVLRVNFLASLWTTFAAIPYMLDAGEGTIVNVSSLAGQITPPRESVYAASKAALDAFTMGLQGDLAGSGIHAGIVIPGAIDTEIWEKEDEPPAFDGRKHPPEVVTRAIFSVVEKKKYVVHAPWFDPPVWAARFLKVFAPAVLRFGLGRSEPIPPGVLDRARARARTGRRLGDLSPTNADEASAGRPGRP